MKKYLLPSLLFICVNVHALTRSELVTECRNLIQDTNTDVTKQRWSSGTIISRLEMGHIDVVSKTRCMQNQAFITPADRQISYQLPSDLLVIQRVGFTLEGSSSTVLTSTSPVKQLARFTILGLDNDNAYWEQLGPGQPQKYYILGSSICLVPKPSAAYSGTYRLKITYVIKPSSMTSDNDTPFNNYPYLYPYHDILTLYAAMKCMLDEGDSAKAQDFQNRYLMALTQMVKEINTKDDWNPNFTLQPK